MAMTQQTDQRLAEPSPAEPSSNQSLLQELDPAVNEERQERVASASGSLRSPSTFCLLTIALPIWRCRNGVRRWQNGYCKTAYEGTALGGSIVTLSSRLRRPPRPASSSPVAESRAKFTTIVVFAVHCVLSSVLISC